MLMIAIVMAGAVIVYVYSSGLLGSLMGAQPQQPYTNQITLEYYSWPNSSKTSPNNMHNLTLYFRNTGSGRAVLADFFVNGTAATLTSGSCTTYTATNTYLLPGGTCVAVLTIPTGLTIAKGYAYSVRLVTRDGSVFSYTLIAGQSGTPS
jgi:archaellum component FlaG (FlaF/FlaG flagellin family)